MTYSNTGDSHLIQERASLFDFETLQEIMPEIPSLDLTHIKRLTNQVSIVQHATYSIPNYKHGYCLDDTSRALMLVSIAATVQPSSTIKSLSYTYLAYIQYMQHDCGRFHNFLNYNNQFLDDFGTEDSYGRTIWALGFFLRYAEDQELHPLAQEMLSKALPHCTALQSVRAISYTLMGLQYYYEGNPYDHEILTYIDTLSQYLIDEYQLSSSADWLWYEQILAYDNAIIPLAILRSGQLLGREDLLANGKETALFLDKLIFDKGFLSTIGNEHWFAKGGARSVFAQQPIEIPSTILLYQELFEILGDYDYKQKMLASFQWYFGKNELGLLLYDPTTKGCCDGLERHGINLNQGAESTISFWLSYLFLRYRH